MLNKTVAAVKSVKLTRTIVSSALAFGTIITFGNVPAQAFQIFFGEDLNNSNSVPLASFPNASDAESNFLSNLVEVGTEDFEGFATGASGLLDLTFPDSDITATLSGGGGRIRSVPVGSTNGVGRYGTSGTNFWELSTGGSNNFQVDFDTAVGAFGFYGIDIGDFAGQLAVELSNGTIETFTVPNTVGSFGSTDGSVLFFGIVAEDHSEKFMSVDFLTTTGQGDVFAFDDFTVGDIEKTPEPASVLGLLALSALGTTFLKRKHKEKV
ncbi:MAG: PEP-CTERM sorting domain-containing protein [Okeania sp. SIO2G4]|uniref:PEP-CTERM sorting domain-containing protein n=1 Tax=unclassified Okeania TaxID=2634635 RepID=UPI0013B8616B|nr:MULTISPECIES: PEP-CTERM sorting domain-containing protein [unclassified Okeania]NEP72597.1 PEP-CTERM sorting domain-containing protein [Okeania sp. SIO2G5]NEP94353.1 PEP-CTERM sorting domain-containing protein [Okeania sp. SIO2F5]NEQ92534.1 PEP-CTERM sorting domain-containing protein [Okeania sp. SIO2G4]